VTVLDLSSETSLESLFEDASPGTYAIGNTFKGDPLTADRAAWHVAAAARALRALA
jgi:hypothetical protein